MAQSGAMSVCKVERARRECVCAFTNELCAAQTAVEIRARRICKPTFLSFLMEPLRRVKWAQLFMECGIRSISCRGTLALICSEARRKDLKHSQRVINSRCNREQRIQPTYMSLLDLLFGSFSIWFANAVLLISPIYHVWLWFCYRLWTLLWEA